MVSQVGEPYHSVRSLITKREQSSSTCSFKEQCTAVVVRNSSIPALSSVDSFGALPSRGDHRDLVGCPLARREYFACGQLLLMVMSSFDYYCSENVRAVRSNDDVNRSRKVIYIYLRASMRFRSAQIPHS